MPLPHSGHPRGPLSSPPTTCVLTVLCIVLPLVEILQIILNELDDPTNLSLLSKDYYAFTQDPYVRASYFLQRYGPIQALYWALGRGRLMNEQVIDVRSVVLLDSTVRPI